MVDVIDTTDKLYLRKVSLQVVSGLGSSTLEGLRIAFDIEKTNEGVPNPAKIEVYNLSDKTRSILEDPGTRVILSAGYKDLFGVIFSGNIVRAKHKKKKKLQKTPVAHRYEGVDIVTEVEAADGGNKYRNAYTVRAFPPGTKVQDVIKDLATDFGMPANIDYTSIPANAQYANGHSIGQETRHALDDICRTHGLEWSIQNEVLQIISKDKTTKLGAILLNPKTGLIGSPVKTTSGCDFEALLQPSLAPGCQVKIESKFVNGMFKVRKVTHNGDSQEGDFLSRCEATLM
jgi:hypothetical protein